MKVATASRKRLTKQQARFIKPMLSLAVAELPDGLNWTYELKFDGYRALGLKTNGPHLDPSIVICSKANILMWLANIHFLFYISDQAHFSEGITLKRPAALRAELATVPVVASAFSAAHLCSLMRGQLFKQGLGVFQVGGIEAFGEPVVDLGEHRAGLVATILRGEKAREARGCA